MSQRENDRGLTKAAILRYGAGLLLGIASIIAVAVFLASQGLDGAAAWAGILALFITVAGVAGPPLGRWFQRHGEDRSAFAIVPRQLPSRDAWFTGRMGELNRLDALLAERTTARVAAAEIVVVSGTPGVGKTALAVHWAHRVRHRFPDGDLYVNLRGYDAETPVGAGEVLDGFLRALGVVAENIPPGLSEQAALYRTLMQGRRVLVVLDNAINAEQVHPLLPGSPSCLVVATSRNQLSSLTTRYGARSVSLDPLPEREAINLLERVIGARVSDESIAAAELTRACGHLPLALRIAAVRIAMHPHSRISDVTGDLAADRLDVLTTPDDDATTAVRRVFSWSYQALPADTARVFRFLGLHAGPDISIPATAALAGISTAEARRQLELLASGHLVDEPEHSRYRLHDLLRIYAAERATAEDPGELRAEAIRRVLAWYLHTADAANRSLEPYRHRVELESPRDDCTPLSFATPDEAQRWCDSERASLVAAVRQAADVGYQVAAWQLPLALLDFFFLRKPWADWHSTHLVGLAAATQLHDEFAEARILISFGARHKQQGMFDEAVTMFRRALGICQRIGDRWGEAANMVNLGHVHRACGRLSESVAHVQPGLALARKVGDRWLETWALIIFGMALRELGRHGEALDIFRKAQTVAREMGSRRFDGMVSQNLGSVHEQLRQYPEALECTRRALTIFMEIDYRHGEAEALQLLGDIQSDAGSLDAARGHWRSALTILEEIDAHGMHVDELRSRLHLPAA